MRLGSGRARRGNFLTQIGTEADDAHSAQCTVQLKGTEADDAHSAQCS